MNSATAVDLAHETIIVALKLGAPVLLLALAVGLVISFLQALTQIQEMTLTFVPKVVAVFVVLLVFLPFMLQTLISFTQGLMERVVSG